MKPQIKTPRTNLVVLGPRRAHLLRDYYACNRAHLAPWEPARNERFYSLEHWWEATKANVASSHSGSALHFAAMNNDCSEVVGVCNLTNISHGVFQACNLGYSIGQHHQGTGLMKEVVEACVGFAFSTLALHRVMANYMPANARSEALLMNLGFEKEGVAKAYLKIAGRWEDHVLTSKINPNAA